MLNSRERRVQPPFFFTKIKLINIILVALMNHSLNMPKERLYWISQLSGWFIYILIIVVLYRLEGQRMNLFFVTNLFITFALGISVSHIYREIIIKRDWFRFKIIALIPRVFFSSIICGTIFFFVHTFIFETLIAKQEIDFDLLVVLQSTMNLSVNFVGWSLLYFLFHFIQNYRKEEIKNLQWQALSNEVELNKLKSQLNPHFIFNSMNSIRALIEEDPEKSKKSITQLSNILRSSLLMGRKKVIPLSEELQLVHDYLDLEQTRFEERLQTEFEIDNNTLNRKIPPMLLQTLVENGIKHGISKLSGGGKLTVKAFLKGEGLKLEILNSGQYQTVKDNSSGFGIANSKQRLHLLYGEGGSFKIGNESIDTVRTEVFIPKQILNKET